MNRKFRILLGILFIVGAAFFYFQVLGGSPEIADGIRNKIEEARDKVEDKTNGADRDPQVNVRVAGTEVTPEDLLRAKSRIESLTVAEEAVGVYDRQDYPHWETIEVIDDGETYMCAANNASKERWGVGDEFTTTCAHYGDFRADEEFTSIYDGVVLKGSDLKLIDVDHVVALGEVFRSGGRPCESAPAETSCFDLERRTEFANAAYESAWNSGIQLIPVSASSNRSKGDRDPANWMPTNTAVTCFYTINWIDIKTEWDLSADKAEMEALYEGLASCE